MKACLTIVQAWSVRKPAQKQTVDHFVGNGEQRQRHGETEYPGGLEIDHQTNLVGSWTQPSRPVWQGGCPRYHSA
jgi:hypothetical protein